jgi:hypothetical protein
MADRLPSLTVRPLEVADKAAWLPLWRGYLAFYEAEIARVDLGAVGAVIAFCGGGRLNKP